MTVSTPGLSEIRTPNNPPMENNRFAPGTPPLNTGIMEGLALAFRFVWEKNQRTPSVPLPSRPVDLARISACEKGKLNATWLGHSTLLINMDGFRILLDPVLDTRLTLLGPSRFNGPAPVRADQLPPVDLVIISHDHYDHLNKGTIQRIQDKVRYFAVPLKVGRYLDDWGVPGEKILEFHWWQSLSPLEGLTVTATPSRHFSGRGLFDRNHTLWASWVIQSPEFSIFFSGDSGYFEGFSQIGQAFGPFDMTFLECGAYNRNWPGVHMFPEQTLQAHQDLRGKILHPVHWGTFNLAFHAWFDPMERLEKAARNTGTPLATPVPGQTLAPGDLGSPWWKPAMDTQSLDG